MPGQDLLYIVMVLIDIAGLVYLAKQLRNFRITLMVNYLFKQLAQIHFCGYPLLDVYLLRFFPRYRKFVDWGFCGPIAGMSMLALKNNKTARYVYALAGKDRCEHCWAEFRYHGTWYVIDVCWQYPFVCARRAYYKDVKPEILKVCNHDQFWSYPVSHQFYEKMQDPKTSWLLCELAYIYNFEEGSSERLFDPEIETVTLPEDVGLHLNPWLYYEHPEIIFSRRIMHEMMQRPNRERPKAHCIRKVKWYRRQVAKAYQEYEREHPDELKAS